MPRPALASVVLVLLAGAACSDDDGTTSAPADRGAAVEAVTEDVIVPGYERLAAETDELATASDTLCAEPSPAAFDAARRAWDDAQGAWSSTAAFRFGPVKSRRLVARIEYPVDTEKVDALALDAPGAAPVTVELLAEEGADLRGLNAVQHLLFTPAEVSQLTARQCAYAAAAATLAAEGAEELRAAWVDGVDGEAPAAEQLTEPGAGGMWESTTEALEDLLNGSLAALGAVEDMQLGPALGLTTEEPEPQEVDDGAAHRALADIVDELRSVAAVYGGDPSGGLGSLVVAAGAQTSDAQIRDDLAAAVEAVGSAPPPLFDLDASDTDSVEVTALTEAYESTKAVRTALSTEVASLLGLTVSFSDSDGDG